MPIGRAQNKVVQPLHSAGHGRNGPVDQTAADNGVADDAATPDIKLVGDSSAPELKPMRDKAARDVQEAYSLLFEHLDLTAQEKDALLAFLIEARIAGTSMMYRRDGTIYEHRGEKMDPDERSDRIAAIIGDAKLQQFLALERNLPSYAEVERIAALLQNNGAPVTETQRDGLFSILVETRDQYLKEAPPSQLESSKSLEHLEQVLHEINEYERRVIALAPSVLSPDQVVYLHEQYQYMSYQRADALELQRDQRADGTIPADRSWWYPTWND